MKESRELIKVEETRSFTEAVEPAARSNGYHGYGLDLAGEDQTPLREYWRAVRKRLWLVIGLTALVTMLTAVYVARQPDIYESAARVQVDLESNPGMGVGAKNGQIIINSPINDPAYFNTQLQILSGPGLLRRVVKTLDLEHNQAFLRPQQNQSASTWQSLLRMVGLGKKGNRSAESQPREEVPLSSSVAPASSRDDLIEAKRLAPFVDALQSALKVAPVKETRTGSKQDTRLIDIRFTHSDSQIAAKIVNVIAETFVLSNLEKKTETNATAGDFLQRRVAELQSQIRTGEEQLINYAKNNQILSLDANQNTVVDRLAGLNRQLLEAENDRKTAEAALKAAQAPGASAALSESAVTEINNSETKLGELRQKLAQLLVENTEEWPEVKETRQQIGALEREIKEVRSRASSTLLTNLQTRYRQALEREQSLRAAFNQQKGETLTQNEAAINYKIIQQEIETNKHLLDGLLQRSKENDVVLAGTPNNISVLDYALVPESPIGPKRMRAVLLALMLSFAAGIGLSILLEYLDDSVHSTDDVEKHLQLPALSVIPAALGIGRRRLFPSAGALQRITGNDQQSPELLLGADARSPLAEAYRQLRTSVLLSVAGRAPKSFLVTSSMPSEGKTTTAVNTAISLTQTGASVVIIDADMRRPRLHTIFDLKNSRGLSNILSSEMDETEMLGLLQSHETPGLSVLPAGTIPPNPAELLGSEQMKRLLYALESGFTYVVVDSPPISSFTDGVLISTLVDGVLLVVHGGKSSRHIVRRSRQILQDVGAKIFGVVLNNVNLRPHDYYYDRYYSQSYYHKDEETASVSTEV